jgi:hypothetical protein
MPMNIDAVKALARNAYKKEYDEKTPAGPVAGFFGIGGALMVGGSFFGGIIGVGALLFGAAVAPAILTGAMLGFVFGMTGLIGGAVFANGRAQEALQRDLDNGTLVRRFQDEVLAPSAGLSGPGPAAAFAAAAPAAIVEDPVVATPAARPPAPKAA